MKLELAKLVEKTPEGGEWLHEMKYDGYRLLAVIENRKVVLLSRNGLDWTSRFPEIEKALLRLKVQSAVLDGEMVVFGKDGLSSFSALQNRLSGKTRDPYTYQVFDLLYFNDSDLRENPLLERKDKLKEVLGRKTKSRVQFVPHLLGHGNQAFQAACSYGMEGVISKSIQSPYLSGRNGDWVKTKCSNEEEFVICGFTNPMGHRQGFGSLLLGYWQGKDLVYCGRVGTGFDSNALLSIYKKLSKKEIAESRFLNELSSSERSGAHFVKPTYVGQIKFTEWTSDGRLRHPVFLGLREDKSPREVRNG